MNPRSSSGTGPAPTLAAAQATFLRGVERRAAVFAELQCGNVARGDQALAVALRGFLDASRTCPRPQWPMQFWRHLLAAPALQDVAAAAQWPPALHWLGTLAAGSRAALLLRMLSGLPDADAGAALGLPVDAYRLALRRALPRRDDSGPDAAGWRALHAAVQDAQRDLPTERLAHLATLRETALHGGPTSHAPPAVAAMRTMHANPARADAAPAPRYPRLLAMVGIVCACALLATFVLPLRHGTPSSDPVIHTEPLPAAARPAATYDRDTALLTDPDFDQIAAHAADAPVGDLDLYSWYAAGAPAASDHPGDTEPAASPQTPDSASDTSEQADEAQ